MRYAWNEANNGNNFTKHGLRFEDVEKETDVSKKSIKSDLARIDRMKDAEIDFSDIPPLGKSFLKKATTAWPPVNKAIDHPA